MQPPAPLRIQIDRCLLDNTMNSGRRSEQTRAVRRVAAMLLAVTLTACAGSSGNDDGASGSGDGDAALADVVRIEAAVDVRVSGADFTNVADRAPVGAGDTVRTDSSGFAEIAYHDGSLTRLDVNTEFEILELSSDPGHAVTRTRMGLGRTWNRVQDVGEGDEPFSVETSVATATVRGTAFVVSCATEKACTFTVVEGEITLSLPSGKTIDLVAPAAVTVTGAKASAPTAVSFDGAFGDTWVLDNARRDTDAGFADAAEIYQQRGPSSSSLEGGFDVEETFDSCTGPGCSAPLGAVSLRHYDFAVDCNEGFPCTGTVTLDYNAAEGGVASTTAQLTFDGTTYAWSISAYDGGACSVGGRETGRVTVLLSYTMQATAAEVGDGRWVTSAVTGTLVGVTKVLEVAPECPDNVGETTARASFAGSR